MKNESLNQALRYAEIGWALLPVHSIVDSKCTCLRDCKTPGKHPVITGWLDKATTDKDTIEKWFRQGNRNIGIACGAKSGIFVIDVDGDEGKATINRLVTEHGEFPRTVEAVSGGGGRHIFFKYEDRIAHIGGKVRILPGIDIRTTGNQVLVAPSKHQSGSTYRFVDGRDPWEIGLATVPEWLIAELDHKPSRAESCRAKVEIIEEGNRNSHLTCIAGKLRRNGADEDELLEKLLVENAQFCQPPLEEDEVRRIAHSVARYRPCVDKPPEEEDIISGSIVERAGVYCKAGNNGELTPISNFTIDPVTLVRAANDAELVVNIVHKDGWVERRTLKTADFNSVSRFKAVINQFSISFSFVGSEKDLEHIKEQVNAKPHDRKIGVYCSGWAEAGGMERFVCGDRVIDAEGNEADDIVLLSSRREIESTILAVDPLTLDELNTIGPSLFRFNDIKRTVPIISFVCGCFLKYKFNKCGIKKEHLILSGEAGGGKSATLENVILPIFSTESRIAASEMTPFTAMKTNSSSNAVPHVIDEYKSARMALVNVNAICNLLRESYDGHKGQRGTSNLSIESFDLTAPVILVGENSPEETAIRERSFEVVFAKRDHTPSRSSHFSILRQNQELLRKLGRSLLIEAMRVSKREIIERHANYLSEINNWSRWPSRVNNNVVNALIGLDLMEATCQHLGTSLSSVSGYDRAVLNQAIFDAINEYLLDGHCHNKSIVDLAIEVFDRMNLSYGVDYQFINEGKELAIRLTGIYDQFTRYVAEHRVEMEILPISTFKRQLKQTKYFVEERTANFSRMTKSRQKAVILDYATLSSVVELENMVPCVSFAKAI